MIAPLMAIKIYTHFFIVSPLILLTIFLPSITPKTMAIEPKSQYSNTSAVMAPFIALIVVEYMLVTNPNVRFVVMNSSLLFVTAME